MVIYVFMLSLICNLISVLSSLSRSWDLPNMDDLGRAALLGRGATASEDMRALQPAGHEGVLGL